MTLPRACTLALAIGLAATPAPSEAIAPALLFMIKQIAQQAASSMIKDTLLSSLRGMGCRGIALSNALTALDLRGGSASALPGGLPKMPAGMTPPTMPNNMAGLPGLAGGTGLSVPPDVAARMSSLMPGAGQLPPGLAMDPQQMAMMSRALQAMNQPLSPADTLATIDELFELGFMPKAIQGEFKECMVLVPATIPALGMGMGLMRPMIPQLRQAREQLHALSPTEQDEVADALSQQLKALPADQRAALVEHLDSGFFPPRISQGAKAGLAAR